MLLAQYRLRPAHTWWLMLKRFLTKRICKRCVTHRVFPFLYSQWWVSLDWNSQTIIFSLLTYWQDAGRGLNGGYPITAIKVKHINIHFSDMLIGSASARLYSPLESHKDQSNSYTDWSCLIEKTVGFWSQETKTSRVQGEQLAVRKREWKSPFIKADSPSLNTGPRWARFTAGCHTERCTSQQLQCNRILLSHFPN